MSYGQIYKITHKISGKCYIGQTTNQVNRFKIHYQKFDPSEYYFKIIAKYNSEEELDNAEKYWIWYYNSFKDGLNKTTGGRKGFKYKSNRITRSKLNLKRLNLTLPKLYKEIFQNLANEKGISKSELLRQWIKEKN